MEFKNALWDRRPTAPSRPVMFEVSKVDRATQALREVPYIRAVEALLQLPPSSMPGELERPSAPTHQRPIEASSSYDDGLVGDVEFDPVIAALQSEFKAHRPFATHQRPIEACSSYHDRLVAGVELHPVIASLHSAFRDHRPLVLSPDMIWLLIAQGLANHVNANPEVVRSKFVMHSGQVAIRVRRDDFIKGLPDNPWPEVFGEFSDRIREHIGLSTHDLLLPNFSTTGVAERAAAEIVLMDAMQSFFLYELTTMCGIPQVVLEGSADDWSALAERTRGIGRFGIERWTGILAPILDEFVAAAQGRINTRFWQSIYKVDAMSGGPYMSGWILAFFPYLKDRTTGRATYASPWLPREAKDLEELLYAPTQGDSWNGPKTDVFPTGLARAPFRWQHLEASYDMEFLGGFVGVRQNADTLALRPEIGWAVRESSPA